MTKKRIIILLAVLVGIALVAAACRKVDSSSGKRRGAEARPSDARAPKSDKSDRSDTSDKFDKSETGKGEGAFDPRLLLSDAATAKYIVSLNMVKAPLEDKRRTALVTVALECANAEAAEKIKKKPVEMQALITEVLSRQSLELANSVAGKMQIQEEIVRAANKYLGHPGIKRVHYQSFVIN